jgi:hypothetical protein
MTFTYNTADLTATSSSGHLAQVRLKIGDTNSADGLLQDEEIYYFLNANSSGIQATSIASCEAIIAEFSRFVDKTVGPFSESLSQRINGYKALLSRLERGEAQAAYPYAGGISITTKDAQVADTDRVPPAFYVGMLDNPNNGEGDSST